MLNAGYRRGATAGRCVIKGKTVETEELQAYAPVALAGLDDLPDTIMTRSIVVRMRRRAPHEQVDSYRRRVHEPDGHALRDRLAAWATSVHDRLDGAWPHLPDGIEDRNADVWEPLLAIADAAGGHWPDNARRSAVTHVTAAQAKGGSLGVRLLADVRGVFTRHGEGRVSTDDLLDALHDLDESPWADLRGKPTTRSPMRRSLGLTSYLPSRRARVRESRHPGGLTPAVTPARPLPDASVTSVTPLRAAASCDFCGTQTDGPLVCAVCRRYASPTARLT